MMKKYRGEPVPGEKELEAAKAALGDAPEVEFTFLLIPMTTYKIALEAARKQGLQVVEVFQRAILQYLQAALNEDAPEDVRHGRGVRVPQPAIVMRRKNDSNS